MKITIADSLHEDVDGTYELYDDEIENLGVESNVTWHLGKAVNVVRRLYVEGIIDDSREDKLGLLVEINRRDQPC